MRQLIRRFLYLSASKDAFEYSVRRPIRIGHFCRVALPMAQKHHLVYLPDRGIVMSVFDQNRFERCRKPESFDTKVRSSELHWMIWNHWAFVLTVIIRIVEHGT